MAVKVGINGFGRIGRNVSTLREKNFASFHSEIRQRLIGHLWAPRS